MEDQAGAVAEVAHVRALELAAIEEVEPADERCLGIAAFQIVGRIEQVLATGLALAACQRSERVQTPRDRRSEAQLAFAVGRDRPE